MNKSLYSDFGVFLLPIGITIFCYIRAVRVLRKNGLKSKDHALFLYPAVQLLLLLTQSGLQAIARIEGPSFYSKRLSMQILQFFECLLGLSNSLIYLIQKTRKPVVQQSDSENSNKSLLRENK